MTAASEWMTTARNGDVLEITLSGDWTIDTANRIDADIADLKDLSPGFVVVDAVPIGRMDTAGAWMIEKIRRRPFDNRQKCRNPGHPAQSPTACR